MLIACAFQRNGRLGDLLRVAESLEDESLGSLPDLLERLPAIGAGDVNHALTQAIAWANEIGSETK